MKHLFLLAVALTGILVVLLPFASWYLIDHGKPIASLVVTLGWCGLCAYLFVRGAT